MLNLIQISSFKNFLKKCDLSSNKQELETLRNLKHQRYRMDILFIFTLVVLLLTFYFCWGIVSDPAANPNQIKSAFEIIKAIITGLIGFLMGKVVS